MGGIHQFGIAFIALKKKSKSKDRPVSNPGDTQLDILCQEQEWAENTQGQESSYRDYDNDPC